MSVLILRNTLLGLLSLTLALPAWGSHVCCCASRLEAARKLQDRQVASEATLRPCCAKKLAAKTAASSQKSGLKAKCCCSDIRWNQAAVTILPVRDQESVTGDAAACGDAVPLFSMSATTASVSANGQAVRASPPEPVRILLCRWQV